MFAQTIPIDQGGRITLPQQILEVLGVQPEAEVVIALTETGVVIKPKYAVTPITDRLAAMNLPVSDWEQIQVQVTAPINIAALIARRLVNIELMKKVGQMIMTGEPEIHIDSKNIYWKVPLFVVSPDDDDNTYLLRKYALVDAIAGRYTIDEKFIEELKAEARPLLERLYPETKAWVQKIKELREKCS